MNKVVYDFSGKVAIVTGSASGIGLAIARALHRSGATVVFSDVQEEKGKMVVSEYKENAHFIACDVSNAQQVNHLVEESVTRFGRLDIMVNNAGINTTKPEERVTIDDYDDATWHRLINVDLNGTFYCCKAAARVMRKQKLGNIINIGSIAGVVALRLQVGFVAAKAAILKMTEAMACELGPYGIRVNAVSPGSTVTETTQKLFYKEGGNNSLAEKLLSFIPMGRPGSVEEIAAAVLFLASESSSYINGQNIVVDGGWISGFNRDF